MDQRKLRIIKPAQSYATEAYGITIPPKIAMFFKNTYFNILKSGTSILLTSGAVLTEKDVENLDLEDFKI